MRLSSKAAVVFLALLLLFSSANCMMACAFVPCASVNSYSAQQSLPPCHRHHVPAKNAPTACAHPLIVADGTHSVRQIVAPEFAAGAALPLPSLTLASAAIKPSTLLASSPPGSRAVFSLILRI
jgi:hypothetical protein